MAPNAGTQERNAGDHKYASSMDPPLRTAGRAASKGKSQRSTAENFGIDESNLETRREFIRLGEEERRLLAGMISWARSIAPQIAREFYDWQFGFGPTRRFFEAHAQNVGASTSQKIEAIQGVTKGAVTRWRLDYKPPSRSSLSEQIE